VAVNPTRLGTAANFNRAFGLCTGDVILSCDQDDYWFQHKLARFEAAFADPNVGLVFSDAWLLDGAADVFRPPRTAWQTLPFHYLARRRFAAGGGPRVLLRYNVVTGAAMAFRADLRDVILPIPDEWVPDAWVAFLASAVADVRLIPEPLIGYRRHETQQIGLSRRTLVRQLRAAFGGRDQTYFASVAARYDQLAERLGLHRHMLRDPAVIELVREKAAMARTQAAMRGANRLDRAADAVGELLAGRYHRFDHGVRAFLADLLGP
jgi:glycosyltransferase involved in cell wall biosynthesis